MIHFIKVIFFREIQKQLCVFWGLKTHVLKEIVCFKADTDICEDR